MSSICQYHQLECVVLKQKLYSETSLCPYLKVKDHSITDSSGKYGAHTPVTLPQSYLLTVPMMQS